MPLIDTGDWKVRNVETGFLWLDGGSMFGSVPKPLWSRLAPPDERNRIRLAMRCLLAEGHGRRVLVDVGAGDKFSPKLRDIYRLEPAEQSPAAALSALGVDPASITDVVLTHLHFDHAAGATKEEGGRLVPSLPHARWHVQGKNWRNALEPNPRERASYMRENFVPLEEAGVVTLWEGPQVLWPGFELFTADGHTRGQQLARISGPKATVYFVADLIPTAAHVRIPFVMGYDMAAIETMEEKRTLLTRAVAEGAWVCLEHDPEIALARPVPEADDFGWSERLMTETPSPVPASHPTRA
jgi:glyoxylase-like metal-dependent hydrolase (beta-lactamase superfamily II)